MTDARARYDEFWNTFHELWGMWHDGVPYSQSVKDKWGRLLHLGKEGSNLQEAAPAQGSAEPELKYAAQSARRVRQKGRSGEN